MTTLSFLYCEEFLKTSDDLLVMIFVASFADSCSGSKVN